MIHIQTEKDCYLHVELGDKVKFNDYDTYTVIGINKNGDVKAYALLSENTHTIGINKNGDVKADALLSENTHTIGYQTGRVDDLLATYFNCL